MRHERGEFVVEGPQGVRELLARPELMVALYATEEGLRRLPEAGDSPLCQLVPDEVLRAMADTRSPQGVLAVSRFLDAELSLDGRLTAVLWQVRDPGNAGTILRAADAAGADQVIFAADSVDPYNDKSVRAAAGSLFHVPFLAADGLAELAALREAGHRILAAAGTGAVPLYDLLPGDGPGALSGPVVWVFGNEAHGLPDDMLDLADDVVAIPHHGPAESLNLAVAASHCLLTTSAAQHGQLRRPH